MAWHYSKSCLRALGLGLEMPQPRNAKHSFGTQSWLCLYHHPCVGSGVVFPPTGDLKPL